MTVPFRLAIFVVMAFAASAVAHAQNAAIGAWDMTTISPEGTTTSLVEIRQEGDKVVAVGKSPRGERPYDSVEVKGDHVTLVITISYNGSPMVITYSGQVTKDGMSGDADFGGLATGSWSAVAHK
jgi:hypothetical protein